MAFSRQWVSPPDRLRWAKRRWATSSFIDAVTVLLLLRERLLLRSENGPIFLVSSCLRLTRAMEKWITNLSLYRPNKSELIQDPPQKSSRHRVSLGLKRAAAKKDQLFLSALESTETLRWEVLFSFKFQNLTSGRGNTSFIRSGLVVSASLVVKRSVNYLHPVCQK